MALLRELAEPKYQTVEIFVYNGLQFIVKVCCARTHLFFFANRFFSECECTSHRVSKNMLAIFGYMRVNVACGFYIRMTQPDLDFLNVPAFVKADACRTVPQIMKAHLRQPVTL